ncbi:alpha/beta fold hydrolase [Actinobacteria bacterium YIM 96077]|uniref:AB hydrolase-1 domain-containing protein n=1 Tax=Phytoactinopolyspora halophila TaxID=1981511 RepID=A0A329QJA2_9ACTN|nr:alpha/beta fold hydrolase [Phytoactinopolyspora halophila]AYY14449.1 alpha/beta fold hydrolase [Actinobacteria bacterium YIM 96077]RAW11442.1 hypothetical protein DPM12_16520 [Phytoactinopolyspora halophila]
MGLYVAESGPASGIPVIFLHGAAASGSMWDAQSRYLANDLRCLVVDLPGHGESVNVAWESLDDAARRVADVIEGRAGGRASVVGLSLGGYVAIHLGQAAPHLVAGMIVSGVSVVPASFGTRVWQRGQLMARYTSVRRLVSPATRTVGGHDSGADDRPDPAAALPRMISKRIADEVINFRLPDRPPQFDCALLAVAGEHESREVLGSLRPLADRFTPSWAKYVPEAGHAWHVEQPELFNAMVHSWVTERLLPPKLRDPEPWMG